LLRSGFVAALGLWVVFGLTMMAISRTTISIGEAAAASRGSYWFLAILEYLLILVLTPPYIAGLVSDRWERGTIELLFTTDLHVQEIVIGLFAARLARIGMMLIGTMPIFCCLIYLGGIEPISVWTCFLGLVLALLGVGSVSLLCSLRSRKPIHACLAAYVLSFGYLAISGCSAVLLTDELDIADWPSTPGWQSPVTVKTAVDVLNSGNLVYLAIEAATTASPANVDFNDVWFAALERCAWFNLILAGVCVRWVTYSLRSRLFADFAGTSNQSRPHFSWSGLLEINPIAWKEWHARAVARSSRFKRFLIACGIAVLFWPALHFIWYLGYFLAGTESAPMQFTLGYWMRSASVVIGLILLIKVALRSAAAISYERAGQTWDGLVASRLSGREIAFGKWLPNLLADRLLWMCLLSIWTMGYLAGVLHPLGMVFFLFEWLAIAVFVNSLGLWCSLRAASSTRVTVWTLGLGFGAVLLSFAGAGVLAEVWEWVPGYEALAVCPTLTFSTYLFSPEQVAGWGQRGWTVRIEYFAAGRRTAAFIRPWIVPLLTSPWYLGAFVILKLVSRQLSMGTARDQILDVVAAEAPDSVNSLNGIKSKPVEVIKPDSNSVSHRSWLREAFVSFSWTDWIPSPRVVVWGIPRLLWLLGPLTILISVYAFLMLQDRRDLERIIAQLDLTEPGWRWNELEAARVDIPPSQNAAVLLTELDDELSLQHLRLVPEIGSLPGPQFRLSDEAYKAIKQYLKPHEPILARALRLAEFQRGRFPEQNPIDTSSLLGAANSHDPVQDLSLLLTYKVLSLLEEGKFEEALACCNVGLCVADAIGDALNEGKLEVRQAKQSASYDLILRCLAQSDARSQLLEPLQRRIAEEDRVFYEIRSIQAMRARFNQWMTLAEVGGLREYSSQDMLISYQQLLTPRRFVQLFRSQRRVHANVLRMQTAMLRAVELPISERAKAFVPIINFFNQATALEMDSLSLPFLPSYELYQVKRRCMVAALAVERYRQSNGDWPNSLNELVPTYLEAVPKDPFTDQAIRYARHSDSVVIYSLGPDGQDDNGNIDIGIQDYPTAGQDLGYRLWNPSKRRQPALKTNPSEIDNGQ
jgi:ABC-type transport system involved in multi-copper enzyme maturation permease subunit